MHAGTWNGWPYRHVGANAVEFEFQRYMPRQRLTRLLETFDLVQIVAGVPAWAHVGRNLSVPVCLQVATLARIERQSLFRSQRLPKRLWSQVMTKVTDRLERSALRHVSAVFVENRWMFDHVCERMDPGRVIFAPPGVDTSLFCPRDYDESGHILCVGRLGDPRKNVPLLFRAYHRLRQIHPNAPPLVLAGKTMPPPDVWALANALDIGAHIRRIENVSIQDLADLYRGASMVVMSSDEEGLGVVLLEAMACGVPVVATRCGGPETAVVDGETGFLVPVGDPEALSDRMRILLMDHGLAGSMGASGCKRVENQFSLAAAGEKFLDRYDQIFSSPGVVRAMSKGTF